MLVMPPLTFRRTGWGGHWRGENATDETVICPLSYETRKPLEGMCGYGYTVASGKLNFYFAADLIHRLYHLPAIGETIVEHYADTYAECLELAKTNPADAVRNTHTLQYFALDVYAYDIALPGEGCTGRDTSASESSSASASSTPAPTSSPTTTPAPSVSAESAAAGQECHTHSDGIVHCIADETATPTSTSSEAASTTADAPAVSSRLLCLSYVDMLTEKLRSATRTPTVLCTAHKFLIRSNSERFKE